MTDESLDFALTFAPRAVQYGADRLCDHPQDSADLTAIVPGRVATVVHGSVFPMLVDFRLTPEGNASLRVLSYWQKDDAEEFETKLEFEGPVGVDDTTLREVIFRLDRLAPPLSQPEGWREDPKIQREIQIIGFGVYKYFVDKVAAAQPDPIIDYRMAEAYLEAMVNKESPQTAKGTAEEMKAVLRALITHVGGDTHVTVYTAFVAENRHHPWECFWRGNEVVDPAAPQDVILHRVLNWFDPTESAFTKFTGNRWSDMRLGPALYRVTGLGDPSGHDRLEALETLDAFLKKTGMPDAEIEELLGAKI